MAANKIKGLTVEIGGDTTKLGKALEDVDKKSRDLSSELGEINKLLKFDPKNTELLGQKQKVLADAIANTSKKLETLEEAEKQVQEQFKRGEVSEEQVRALQREILATTKKLNNYEKAADDTAEALKELGDTSEDLRDDLNRTEKDTDETADSLDDMEESADEAGEASEGMGKKLASAAKGGAVLLASAVGAVVGALVGATEASREYRTEMGKLDTAFTTNGHSSQAAYKTYGGLQGVLGETDQAVEAANHLAKLTDNEEDLAKWTDVCTGVYATFGASLPIEGLTEAANETAKLGQLTGPLADALNWAGVNEEKFQAQLEACSNEQERQTLILETLNGLYGEAAEAYKETNSEIIRANQANEEWNATMAEIGGAVEPILTDVKLLGASLLADLVPGVKSAVGAFRGLLNGDEDAADALGASISGLLTHLLDVIVNVAPKVAETALSLITSLGMSLLSMTPQLLSTGFEIAMSLIDGLTTAIPQIIAQGAEVLRNLGEGIAQNLPTLVSQGLDALMGLATALYDNAPVLIDAGISLLSNLVQGVVDSVPLLLEKGPEIISKLANIISDNAPN